MATGKVIVLSTHILEEVEAVCTRAIIVSEGKLRFDGTPRELRERSRFAGAVEVTVAPEHADAASATLAAMGGSASVELTEATDETTRITVFPHEDARGAARRRAGGRGGGAVDLISVSVDRGRMDDVFRTVTTANAGA